MEVGVVGKTLTALTCMYEKPYKTMAAVVGGLLESPFDERIVVLDRPKPEDYQWVSTAPGIKAFSLTGPPGWRSPCLSWNVGMKHVTGDLLLILQGDIVLTPGSVAHARRCLEERPAVYFGMVTESDPQKYAGVAGHAVPILCFSDRPRPLTYLLAVPTQSVQDIGGWDEAYQAGAWYEADDFTARLWQHGLDFIFDDRISGIHQTHARTYAKPIPIAVNQAIFLGKFGTTRFWDRELARGKMQILKAPGRTEWRHA